MTHARTWMWMAVLTLGSVGTTSLAQPAAPATTAAKTREGKVKSITGSSIQLEGATAAAPPLTYVVDTSKPQLKKTLEGLKSGDSVRVTYAPNDIGVKVITQVEKL